MQIKIQRQNCDDLINLNKIRWRLFQRNNLVIFTFYALVGIIFITIESEKPEGPMSAIGLSFLFLSAIYSLQSFRNRFRYLKRTRDYINRFLGQSLSIEILISDSVVSYKDFESSVEMKWTVFSHYQLYKDYLFLFTVADYLAGIAIKKTEISKDEFKELLDFVTKKLPQKT